jgi:hypothetical protein
LEKVANVCIDGLSVKVAKVSVHWVFASVLSKLPCQIVESLLLIVFIARTEAVLVSTVFKLELNRDRQRKSACQHEVRGLRASRNISI